MNDYKRFPVECLPDSVARFVTESAGAMMIDPAFVALPALSALGAAVGTAREIELKRGWCEPPVIWSCIIARSGTLKTPAMEKAIAPLAEAEHVAQIANQAAAAQHEADMLHYEKELAAWKRNKSGGAPPEKPSAPPRLRYIVADATLEAIAPLLQENPHGLLLARDELAAWVRGFNQYKGGKGGDAAAWLEFHRAGNATIDRKSSGTIYIPRAAVSICGTIQPGVFASAMHGEHFESGLAARLLISQPPTKPKRFTSRSVSAATSIGYGDTVTALLALQHEEGDYGPRPRRLPLSNDAREVWREWYDLHAKRQHEAGEDAVAAMLSKVEAYAARFALIFQLAETAGAFEVSPGSIRRGCELADWFAGEAERVYARLADDDETRELRQLLEWIGRRGGAVTIRDLTHGLRRFRADSEGARAVLDDLAASGVGRWIASDGPGRPTDRFELLRRGVTDTETHENPNNGEGFGYGDSGGGAEAPCADEEVDIAITERAAIMQFDAGLTKAQAEYEARRDVPGNASPSVP